MMEIITTYEMKRDNAYLTQNNGLDFGMRYNYYPYCEKTGVVRVVEFENVTTPAEQIANIRIRNGLKHKVSSISQLKTGKLTDEQIDFFL